jgi:hypothetical protein
MPVRTVMEKDLHMLCEKAIKYDALEAGGVDNWPYYGDSIVEWGPYTWDDEEEVYVEDPQMIDDMVDRYTVNADSIIKNDLLDLMSLIDHKIDIYEQVMNNWDLFLDYVWNSKQHRTTKNAGRGYVTATGKCPMCENCPDDCPMEGA